MMRCDSASRALAALGLLLLPVRAPAQAPDLSSQVEIVRTAHGVPHIFADNFRAAGYALGWAQLEDYGDFVPSTLSHYRGELGLQFGRDSLPDDFVNRPRWLLAVARYPTLSDDARAFYEGYAAGVNRYLELHPAEFAAWLEPDFRGVDVLAADIEWPADVGRLRAALERQRARRSGEAGDGERLASEAPVIPSQAEDQRERGSNAWALAPSRTTSGNSILLRNPHLRWTAGYYEFHLIIPGELDFYGDTQVGHPLQTVGGFNARLGWATTNNGPDDGELYLLQEDPSHPDHYLFDGVSIPLQRIETTLPYRSGDTVATETRVSWETHLGPVLLREDGQLQVWKASGLDQYRLADQWLGMMRARNLEEWQDAMRMLQKRFSNFTYADADGNIFYVWNGHVPELRRPDGADTVAVPAVTSDDVWARLYPFDALPHLENPMGGYIHQENDPFHYTNLNQIIPADRFPDNFPRPELSLRSQHSLSLIGGTNKLSLDDVIRLKHSYRMLLADRVKTDLIAAVRAASRSAAADSAAFLLERWDNTVAPDSRGSTLFEIWWARYRQTAEVPPGGNRNAALYREPWTTEAPTTTPRGLADPARAATAFGWAVEETARRYGSWDVAWGDVHRVRQGDVDVPVGGCSGSLGCFRVLSYRQDPDGKLRAATGDAWVLAVEFGDVPRAWSILAYGESSLPGNPHHDDQAAMFARGELKPVAFSRADIERQAIRRYRPGRQ